MAYILYGDKGSGAFSAEAVLAEAGAPYDFKLVSLEKNEQREPAFLAINPSGKMPALRLPEGQIVTESLGDPADARRSFSECAAAAAAGADPRAPRPIAGSPSWRRRSIRWSKSPTIPNAL